jgi:hypothetical protein
MKRTSIKIPDEVDLQLRHEARLRGLTISEITRDAIIEHLRARGRHLIAAGAGRSGRTDVSERIEEILTEELG